MNFIFWSKLLPLFFYPLGLVCLLLIISLIIWWKRPAWTPIPIMLALLILFLSSNSLSSNFIVRSLELKYFNEGELPQAEAIVVLGGGTQFITSPKLIRDLGEQVDRVFYAAKLYHEKKAPLIIATGGRIAWLGNGMSEATQMANILIKMDVPSSAIVKEPNAINTYENGVNVRKILDRLKINKVLLVTSALHMPRSIMVFENQGIKVIPAPTDFLVSPKSNFFNNSLQVNILSFFPDPESLSRTTQAIKEYIGILIYQLKGWI